MSGTPPRGAVVVVSYGSHGLLRTNLAAAVDGLDVDTVVVDSYSDDAERHRVSALCTEQGWHLVALDENRGFGGGMNAGVQAALDRGADAVALLNPDLTLAPQGVTRLLDAASQAGTALVAPRIERPDGTAWAAGTTDLHLDDGTMRSTARRPVPGDGRPRRVWLSGACLALSAALWRTVGGFDERYFLYWEDVDLSHRVLRAGGELVVMDDVVAVHDEGATHDDAAAGARGRSATYYYYNARNRLLYAAVWLDRAQRRQWIARTPRAARALLLQGGRRQLVTSWAPWRAVVRGTLDGTRLLRSAAQA